MITYKINETLARVPGTQNNYYQEAPNIDTLHHPRLQASRRYPHSKQEMQSKPRSVYQHMYVYHTGKIKI